MRAQLAYYAEHAGLSTQEAKDALLDPDNANRPGGMYVALRADATNGVGGGGVDTYNPLDLRLNMRSLSDIVPVRGVHEMQPDAGNRRDGLGMPGYAEVEQAMRQGDDEFRDSWRWPQANAIMREEVEVHVASERAMFDVLRTSPWTHDMDGASPGTKPTYEQLRLAIEAMKETDEDEQPVPVAYWRSRQCLTFPYGLAAGTDENRYYALLLHDLQANAAVGNAALNVLCVNRAVPRWKGTRPTTQRRVDFQREAKLPEVIGHGPGRTPPKALVKQRTDAPGAAEGVLAKIVATGGHVEDLEDALDDNAVATNAVCGWTLVTPLYVTMLPFDTLTAAARKVDEAFNALMRANPLYYRYRDVFVEESRRRARPAPALQEPERATSRGSSRPATRARARRSWRCSREARSA